MLHIILYIQSTVCIDVHVLVVQLWYSGSGQLVEHSEQRTECRG